MSIGTQTIVSGARTNYGVTAATLKVRDVEDKINLLDPYLAPIDDFFATNKLANQVTTGEYSKFEWFEDAFLPDVTTLSAGITGGSTTESTVTTAADIFLDNDTVLIEETDELLLVTTANTGSVDLKHVGSGNITAAAAGGRIQRLVPAFTETGTKQSSMTVLAVAKYGYCQIIKKGLSMSGRQMAAKQYGGDDWSYQWIKAAREIKEALERTFLYNDDGYVDTSNGRSYSAGFLSLTTNCIEYAGTLNKVKWDSGLQQIFENGKASVLNAYAGGDALSAISAFASQPFTYSQTGSSMNITRAGIVNATEKGRPKLLEYVHPMGIVNVYWNPQLKGSKYSGYILIMNPENVKKRFMAPDKKGPRKYRVEMGIETPGADQYDAQYLFDQGLQIKLEESHGWFKRTT